MWEVSLRGDPILEEDSDLGELFLNEGSCLGDPFGDIEPSFLPSGETTSLLGEPNIGLVGDL